MENTAKNNTVQEPFAWEGVTKLGAAIGSAAV